MISIIVPCYNVEQYLERCLYSVIMQKNIDWEIIAVDDCSKDKTVEILKQFSEKYPNIKYWKLSENKGVGNARNFCVNKAKGDYFLFLDADDYLFDQNALANLWKTALDEKAAIVHGGVLNVMEPSGQIFAAVYKDMKEAGSNDLLHGKLIHKDVCKLLPFSTLRTHEDSSWYLALKFRGDIPEAVYPQLVAVYHQNNGSITKEKTKMHYLNMFEGIHFIIDYQIQIQNPKIEEVIARLYGVAFNIYLDATQRVPNIYEITVVYNMLIIKMKQFMSPMQNTLK